MSCERVVILGAGISGLVCAYELAKKNVASLVLEAGDRVGGKIWSPRAEREGLIYEAGPDSFVTTKPAALDLALELGLEKELLTTHAEKKGMWVYTRGRLRRFPEGLLLMAPTKIPAFLFSDIVGVFAKLRMVADVFLPAGDPSQDESINAFAQRRFGVEAAESFINPVMAGIHSGDPDLLSLKSTFPQFFKMEREHGSIIRAMRTKRRPSPQPDRSMFMTLRGGIEGLTQALSERISGGAIRLGARVEKIHAMPSGYFELHLSGGERVTSQNVICTVPSPAAARIFAPISEGLAYFLSAIPFASTATVSLAYDAKDVPASVVDGFGFVVDRRERETISGATYSSTKFPGRVPEGTVLVRCFVGGAGRGAILEDDDAMIVDAVCKDLKTMAGLEAVPVETRIARWPHASPQYEVGHAERIASIESFTESHKGIIFAGASYRGIGLPDCIRSGREAAKRVLDEKRVLGAVV
ncbi:MAG: protoporphyrinogen oxidase [Elusimicrobia bacterium]|nr:MAG: protoporphyrinogen oxidase [Elusimicrobiota bacterium]